MSRAPVVRVAVRGFVRKRHGQAIEKFLPFIIFTFPATQELEQFRVGLIVRRTGDTGYEHTA
jgi:hypothetical protein